VTVPKGLAVMTLEHPTWVPPRYPVGTPQPVLWSARRTAVAIVAAVGIGSLTAVTASSADTGSAGTGTFGNGQFQGPGGGQFNGGPFGRRPFSGNGRFGNGQLGTGQPGGPLQGGQFGSTTLPGAP
jgi:hypothetical protein